MSSTLEDLESILGEDGVEKQGPTQLDDNAQEREVPIKEYGFQEEGKNLADQKQEYKYKDTSKDGLRDSSGMRIKLGNGCRADKNPGEDLNDDEDDLMQDEDRNTHEKNKSSENYAAIVGTNVAGNGDADLKEQTCGKEDGGKRTVHVLDVLSVASDEELDMISISGDTDSEYSSDDESGEYCYSSSDEGEACALPVEEEAIANCKTHIFSYTKKFKLSTKSIGRRVRPAGAMLRTRRERLHSSLENLVEIFKPLQIADYTEKVTVTVTPVSADYVAKIVPREGTIGMFHNFPFRRKTPYLGDPVLIYRADSLSYAIDQNGMFHAFLFK